MMIEVLLKNDINLRVTSEMGATKWILMEK